MFPHGGGWAQSRREGRHVGEGGEEVVGFVVEVDLPLAFAFGGGEEDAGSAIGAERDVGGEAGAASGFFEEGRGVGWIPDLNPGQSDAGWIACVTEALNGFELCRIEISGERGSGQGRRVEGAQQILEELGHVGGG